MIGQSAMMRALLTFTMLIWAATGVAAQTEQDISTFQRATKAMSSGDWTGALAAAEGVSPVARDIIEWHRLRSGQGDFDATTRFLARNPDWPGLKLLRRRSEKAVPYNARSQDVIAFFESQPPQTGSGSRALAEAYRVSGRTNAAQTQAVMAWITQTMSASEESELLAKYSDVLKPLHWDRLDMLLWENRRVAAERMYPRVSKGQRALARARLALRANKNGVDGLIAAVPKDYADDAGLAFERMQWRARKGMNESAIDLMLSAKGSIEKLGRPSRWAGWRRAFARQLMRAGKTSKAYQLASQHGLAEGSSFADLEWLSGYLALTYRDDPEQALKHFLRFRGAVYTPISLGRAGYWEGRAHEALGDAENAQLAYAFGAEYQTSFYGQLAAEKAGRAMDPALTGRTDYPDWRETSFANSTVFAAARLFIAAGQRNLAEQFLTHLAESLDAAELGSLGDFVLSADEPHLAVMIAKRAARQGRTIPHAYFPVVDLGVERMPVSEELALAIARRESEFDTVVMSGVGARGLMQLMPGTARDVAKSLDLPYSRNRLITDPVYNATLGTAYLAELMQTFDGNIVMVSAGYNAGPGRPINWMNSRGDPRRTNVDIVDWIEHIPFDETRNYVMRVAESMAIYRARISGETVPWALTAELTGTGYDQPRRPRPRRVAATD